MMSKHIAADSPSKNVNVSTKTAFTDEVARSVRMKWKRVLQASLV